MKHGKQRLHLSLEELENIWAGLGLATRIGLTPNETLDIHFDRGRLIDPHTFGRPCLAKFLKSARQWIERHGEQTAYIWAIENRGDGEGHGLHAHVLIHVPRRLADRFHVLKPRWARKAGLDMAIAGVIKRTSMPTLEAAKGKLQYISKDLDPEYWPIFQTPGQKHLDDRNKPSDQPVYGKKCGVSRNIDWKARREASAAWAIQRERVATLPIIRMTPA